MSRTAPIQARSQPTSTADKRPSRSPSSQAPGPASFPAKARREDHLQLLLELTQVPTCAGREWRVVEWITRWASARPDLALTNDRAGNMLIAFKKLWKSRSSKSPILITAHLDHPAFVVHRVIGPGTLELAFRGGVMDVYFANARVVVHTHGSDGKPLTLGATLAGEGEGVFGLGGERLFKTYLAELDEPVVAAVERAGETEHDADEMGAHAEHVRVGDVATWALPPAEVDDEGIVHTPVCDDLAALAAALCAFDVMRELVQSRQPMQDVRLLFTRSEEIGFTGAIAACIRKTIPRGSRVIALENSRASADAPIGGGPIVRVGDRLSIFDPELTAACAAKAEWLAGRPATPKATERTSTGQDSWKWQRKLMSGGACEATVFCAYGYQSTCLCLPLGNYHNMADLQGVQDGTHDASVLGPPRIAREYIHSRDYFGLIDLLVGIGQELPVAKAPKERMRALYDKHAFVLEEGGAGKGSKTRGVMASAARKRPVQKRAKNTKRSKSAGASRA